MQRGGSVIHRQDGSGRTDRTRAGERGACIVGASSAARLDACPTCLSQEAAATQKGHAAGSALSVEVAFGPARLTLLPMGTRSLNLERFGQGDDQKSRQFSLYSRELSLA